MASGSAHNVVESNKPVVPFVWPKLAGGREDFVRDTPGGDEVELVESVSLTLTTT